MGDTFDEAEELQKLIDADQPTGSVKGFDLACLFLLDLQFENLFEPATAEQGNLERWRCKGCRAVLGRRERKHHHELHVRARNRGDYNATSTSKGGRNMATDAKKTPKVTPKVTAKDQGFPAVYLAPNGNFKPGLDAAAKGDLVCAFLEIPKKDARHTFTKAEAEKLLKVRDWMSFVDKKRKAIANADERKARAAAKKTSAAKKTASAKKSSATAKSGATGTEVKPDPKPSSSRKKRSSGKTRSAIKRSSR